MPEPFPADLFAAIDSGDAALVEGILAVAPGLASARDEDRVSAPMHALYRGQSDVAEAVARALPALDIFEAAALGRLERVRELLAADPAAATARSADGFTALHYPAFFGLRDPAAISEALIEAGADVNARSDNDFAVMPLHSAVAGEHDAVVAALLAAGADPNVSQRHGWTPLQGAAANGSLASVEALLAAGADPAARNDDGATAFDLARTAGHDEIAERLTVESGPESSG